MSTSMLLEGEYCDSRWKSISVDGARYSICSAESNGIWKISVTNLIEIWSEELDQGTILQKCERLNPSLSIEDIDVHELVSVILKDIPKHATDVSVERIKLSSELDGGVFVFTIDLAKGSAQQLWEEVTKPLCLAAEELRRQQAILLDLMKKKDAEISEYKLNGAELIRKHIRTEPFHKDLLKRDEPTENGESCQATFQKIVMPKTNVKKEHVNVKSEPSKTCSGDAVDNKETTVKVEVEENSEEANTDLVTRNGSSDELVSKSEKDIPLEQPELPSPSTSRIKIEKSPTIDNQKRQRSAPSTPTKRTRRSIHDFIK